MLAAEKDMVKASERASSSGGLKKVANTNMKTVFFFDSPFLFPILSILQKANIRGEFSIFM